MAFVLCFLAFVVCYWMGKRSLKAGLLAVFSVGYVYGIVRANVLSPATHMTFDAAIIGLYGALFLGRVSFARPERARELKIWTSILIVWPLLMMLLPYQPWLISLVGLRGNAFLLPGLLIGAWLVDEDLRGLALGVALLNIFALGFAVLEYFVGVERFFPPSAVTSIVLASRDVAGYSQFRIPSTFITAHAYAGTMAMTLPLLFGLWSQPQIRGLEKLLSLAGISAALLGVLMASTRLHFVIAVVIVLAAVMQRRLSIQKRVMWGGLILALALTALSNERLQRFRSLGDRDHVMERVAGSVNHTFVEILFDFPMGNGLGSGGTSIPYFLQTQLRRPVEMENEYARILLEQGIIGLMMWVAFIFWFFVKGFSLSQDQWYVGRRLAWLSCSAYFASGVIGIGLLTAIPQSFLFLVSIGWVAANPARRR